MGLTLWGRSGSPIGLPVVMSAQPMPDVGLAAGLLKLFAVTVAAEIERVEAAGVQGSHLALAARWLCSLRWTTSAQVVPL